MESETTMNEQDEFEFRLRFEKETQGGVALGNPSIQAQGAKALRQDVSGRSPVEALAEIGGAGAIGAGMGAMAPEIAQGLGRALSAVPHPAAKYIGAGLESSVPALRNAGRVATAISGGISGATAETAGQVVEATGAPQIAAEATRFVAGGLSGETAYLAKEVLKKYGLVPALGLASKFKHEAARKLLDRIERGSLTIAEKERELLSSLDAELRGGTRSDDALENVGSIMGDEGQRLLSAGEAQRVRALAQAGGVGKAGMASREMADVGSSLRSAITTRNEEALSARSAAYSANEIARDEIVAKLEQSGRYVNNSTEYLKLLSELNSHIQPGKRSRSVQSGYEKVLSELTNPEKDVFGQAKPISFQVLDDVRRKLGDAFRGKPAEGYDAIGETAAKDLYHKISNIQKQYAGGPGGPQAKLLDDYASATPGLEKFSSKFGKKATALDQYRDEQFATDASTLPSAYFKTRESIQALHQLVKNRTQVNAAALDFADKQLVGKDSAGVRSWMGKNAEWLSETGVTRTLIDRYATRMEAAEQSTKRATEFATKVARNNDLLVGNRLPAQRAVDLINSKNPELWDLVIPAIAKSPQAKMQMIAATRQVIADQSTAKGTADLFSRNIRPFLEGSNIATTAEMDAVEKGIAAIQNRKISDDERLGRIKRLILQSFGGYAATSSRIPVGGYGLLSDMVPGP